MTVGLIGRCGERFTKSIGATPAGRWVTAALILFCFAAASNPSLAQHSHDGHQHQSNANSIDDVDAAKIEKPGDLDDISIGKADAPVTIIEYASLTCSHCGRFHRELLPELKAKYIDKGIARFVIREFPHERVAAAAAMMARCSGPDKTYDVIHTLFERQQKWLASNDVRSALVSIGQEFGMSEKSFENCLSDIALLQKINHARKWAREKFGVRSTPTFFINGKALVGPRSIQDFDRIIEPMINR